MEKWLEIDLDKLKFNIHSLKNYFKVPIMAVIKQNAYGLGDATIARFMEKQGINFFAVTTEQEGVNLRKGGVTSPILAFAPYFHDPAVIRNLARYDIIPAVYSLESAEILNSYALNAGRTFDVHIKVDTGMGRMGFIPNELLNSADRLLQMKGLNFKGIFTHYSNAFEKEMGYTKKQLAALLDLIEQLERAGLSFELRYSANSMAALKFPETHMDIVSIGSAFLGNSVINSSVPLKKVYKCRVRVLQVKHLKKGSYVGYSNTYKTKRDTRAAVIAIGYTDGLGLQKKIDSFRFMDFLREQVNLVKTFVKPRNFIFYQGKPLKIIGKTSLQLTVVDVGNLPVKAGDVVDVEINPLLVTPRMNRVYTGEDAKGVLPSNLITFPEKDEFIAEAEVAASRLEDN